MRRVLASLLLALFGVPLIAPILCAESAASVPSCCRRTGEHHCAMPEQTSSEQTSGSAVKSIQPRCPLFPKVSAVAVSFDAALMSSSTRSGVPLVLLPEAPETNEAIPQLALRGSVHKRGPPSSLD